MGTEGTLALQDDVPHVPLRQVVFRQGGLELEAGEHLAFVLLGEELDILKLLGRVAGQELIHGSQPLQEFLRCLLPLHDIEGCGQRRLEVTIESEKGGVKLAHRNLLLLTEPRHGAEVVGASQQVHPAYLVHEIEEILVGGIAVRSEAASEVFEKLRDVPFSSRADVEQN